MTPLRTLRQILSILAIAGLIAAPAAKFAVAAANAQPGMTLLHEGMPCCPDDAPMTDCAKACAAMTACASKCSGGVATMPAPHGALWPDRLDETAAYAPAQRDRAAEQPAPRPPNS